MTFKHIFIRKRSEFSISADNAHTDVAIRVENEEDGYFYIWDVDKLQNRLFMMREHLNQYFEDGKIPDYSDKDKDPFWDPPEPYLVGTGYMILKNLGYMIENSADLKIMSSEGMQGVRGLLNSSYWPCAPNGVDEIGEDMLIDDPSELLGKDLYFRMEISHATDLPKDLCKNVFVTYCFKHEPNVVYSTGETVGFTQNPVFNYKKVHCFEQVSSYMIDYIESGDVS
jgi:hypothetical protein